MENNNNKDKNNHSKKLQEELEAQIKKLEKEIEEEEKAEKVEKEKLQNNSEDEQDKKSKGKSKNKWLYPSFFAGLLLAVILGAIFFGIKNKNEEEYNYNNFIQELKEQKIERVIMTTGSRNVVVIQKTEEQIKEEKTAREEENQKELEDKENENNEEEKENKKLTKEEAKELLKRTKNIQIPTVDSFTEFVQSQIAEGNNVEFIIESPPVFTRILATLFSLLPTMLLLALIIMTMKMQGLGDKGKIYDDEEKEGTGVKFEDVAGLNEEKIELMEIVDFLKSPKKYKEMGAKVPKGVLLYGKPGTGKTLIVKAIAGEAGVPFISMSGSEFVEMFAGLGASRVRKLFDRARKISPCIIFIDEIDAIGSQRTTAGSGGESENNQTLNQLLVEMDGFNTDDNVIVIAATNRPEMLDPALLRPGRFDRQIVIPTPDITGREDILKLHARGKKISEDVDFKEIAGDTAGFTGAELANILNEAAILATRRRKDEIEYEEIDEAIKKVTVGLEKQHRVISDKDKKITAYHEAGHAVVSKFLPTQEDIKEISIISRGMAGGYTMYKTTEDKSYISKQELEERMVSLMGGRAAEALVIGDISTGASNDLEVDTVIARNMITIYGMNEKIGPLSLKVDEGYQLHFFGDKVTAVVGEEIKETVVKAYNKAFDILQSQEEYLHKLANILLDKEKVTTKEFEEVFKEVEEKEIKEDNNIKEI